MQDALPRLDREKLMQELLAEADRPPNLQIAAELGCSRHTVALWRDRFLEQGLPGLQDAPRSGRPPRFPPLDSG